MVALPSTNYLPAVSVPDDGEKYRLLEHHRRYGVCPASKYRAMPAEMRPEHPAPIRNPFVTKSQPLFYRRLTFIRFLLGRLQAF